jgi:acyl-CoA thioesterase
MTTQTSKNHSLKEHIICPNYMQTTTAISTCTSGLHCTSHSSANGSTRTQDAQRQHVWHNPKNDALDDDAITHASTLAFNAEMHYYRSNTTLQRNN